MATITSDKLVARMLNRRGNRVNLPQPLEPGELGWCLDTKQLFVGLDSEHAIAALQAFNTVDSGDVNSILNLRILQMKSPWIRLCTPIIETKTYPNEETKLQSLASIPPSSFITEHNQTSIGSLEANIRYLSLFKYILATNVSQFTYAYDWEVSNPVTADGSVVLNAGAVTDITINDHGVGYLGGESISVSISGDGSNAAATAVVDQDTGLIQITITNGGSGYTTATVTFGAPQTITEMTSELYRFTINVGIPSPVNQTDIENLISALNDSANVYYQRSPSSNPSALPDIDLNGFQLVLQSSGVLGANAAPGLNAYGTTMSEGILYLDTIRQTSNVAGLVNKMDHAADPSSSGLVTSKQNVEILNEFSSELLSSMTSDFLVSHPLCYKLFPTTNRISAVRIDGGGTGYVVSDVLNTTGGTGTGAQITVSTVSGGIITGFTVSNGGSSYVIGDVGTVLTTSGGTGAGATFKITNVIAGAVTEVAFSGGGDDYQIGDILDVSGGTGSDAAFSVTSISTNGGVITGISVTNGGFGYTVSDALTTTNITGAGTGATFTVTTVGAFVYDDIRNDGLDNLYTSGLLTYDVGDTDVQVIEYSLTDDSNLTLRTGTLRVNTVQGNALVEDDYSENRDGALTPVSLGGPDFDFNASVVLNDLTMEYRHDFTEAVYLKVTTRRWKSFNV